LGSHSIPWPGFSVYSFSATADGKKLVFLRGNDHASVFVGDLAGKKSPLVNSRRLTLDDNYRHGRQILAK
jgi:hypothetical protein